MPSPTLHIHHLGGHEFIPPMLAVRAVDTGFFQAGCRHRRQEITHPAFSASRATASSPPGGTAGSCRWRPAAAASGYRGQTGVFVIGAALDVVKQRGW